MPRFSIFLVEYVGGVLRPQVGITGAFLQPQPDVSSANPSSKTADSDSIALSQSGDNPGQWYADIDNPAPRYDLYINGNKQSAFSGSEGFEFPSSKSIYVKKNVMIDSTAWVTPESFTVGSGKLATPDGGQTWPKFSSTNKPAIFISPVSQTTSETPPPQYWRYRDAKVVGTTIQVSSGVLSFSVQLDPNGPDLTEYPVDFMIIML